MARVFYRPPKKGDPDKVLFDAYKALEKVKFEVHPDLADNEDDAELWEIREGILKGRVALRSFIAKRMKA